MIYYTNELYHHGVKGMKWGVRKDRAIANFKAKRSAKRKDKAEKYRNKLISKAERREQYRKETAKDYKNKIEDLDKNGMKSETYKKYVQDKKEEAFIDDMFDDNVTKSQAYARQWAMDLTYNSRFVADYKISELKTSYSTEYEYNKRVAKRYLNAKKELMNFEVTDGMSKKDVRRKYKEAMRNG